jgi:hypothetical protein
MAITTLVLLAGLVAADQPAPHAPAASIASAPVALRTPVEKVDFLQKRFREQTAHGLAWFGTWIALYGALGIGQTILACVLPAGPQRANYAVGAVLSWTGLLGHVVFPYEAGFVERRLDNFDDSKGPEAKAAYAEELMRSAAKQASGMRGWINHVLPVVAGAGAFLVLWLRYNQLVDGLVTFFASTAIAEVRVWSAPTHMEKIQREYDGLTAAPAISFTPVLVPGGFGLAAKW